MKALCQGELRLQPKDGQQVEAAEQPCSGGGRTALRQWRPGSPAGNQHSSSLISDCQSAHGMLCPCTGGWRVQPKVGQRAEAVERPCGEGRGPARHSTARAAQLGISIYETDYERNDEEEEYQSAMMDRCAW